MNQSLTLPMADKFYHDKQTSAFIRSVNVSWEKPEKDHYYLESVSYTHLTLPTT